MQKYRYLYWYAAPHSYFARVGLQFSGIVNWHSLWILHPDSEGGRGGVWRSWDLASRRIVCICHTFLGTPLCLSVFVSLWTLALAVVRGSEKWVSCSCHSLKLWEWVSCSLWFTSSSFIMIHNSTWYVSWNSGYRFCRPIFLPRFWADYYILTYCWELMKSLLFVNEGDRSDTFWVTLISLWPDSLSSYLQIVVAEISLQFHRYDMHQENVQCKFSSSGLLLFGVHIAGFSVNEGGCLWLIEWTTIRLVIIGGSVVVEVLWHCGCYLLQLAWILVYSLIHFWDTVIK
jgi:hypothetical protein